MSFLDILHTPKDTLDIFNGITLKEGDIVNIYGESFVGKTLFCYWVMHNNQTKTVAYFDTESSPYDVINKMIGEIPILYTVNNDLDKILDIIQSTIDICDYYVIDSFTATDFEQRKKTLLQICNVVKKNNKNLLLVSQIREYDGKQYYEYKKFLDFCSFKANITEISGESFMNGEYIIKKNFLETYKS